MYPTMVVANQESLSESVPSLTHGEGVARLAGIVAAMAAVDRQIEVCTDPRAESCLLTLRTEYQVGYLEALYGWKYEAADATVIQ
jgi:hypothetical protein